MPVLVPAVVPLVPSNKANESNLHGAAFLQNQRYDAYRHPVYMIEARSQRGVRALPASGWRRSPVLHLQRRRRSGPCPGASSGGCCSVERALRRRGLLLPRGFRADRKSWAALRRKVFHDPPTERNRVWQTDFSEFETAGGGIWRICAVIDYATKYCFAARITPSTRPNAFSAWTT